MPQVAYSKPKQFKERLIGDSFYAWDADGKKYAVSQGLYMGAVIWF